MNDIFKFSFTSYWRGSVWKEYILKGAAGIWTPQTISGSNEQIQKIDGR